MYVCTYLWKYKFLFLQYEIMSFFWYWTYHRADIYPTKTESLQPAYLILIEMGKPEASSWSNQSTRCLTCLTVIIFFNS